MESIVYVGMDVHKDSYSICCYKAKEDKFYYEKKVKAETKRVIKYLESVKEIFGEETIFFCGYEAGPTGFGLYRDLEKEGYACVVMAPTSLKKSANQKVKNDRVDARYLAKTLFTKDYSAVNVTTEEEEAIKEFCQMRLSIQTELKESKQKLLSFLLRQGKKYEESGYWTIKHKNWLSKLEFENQLLKEIFNEYMISVNANEQRLKTIENRLKEIAKEKVVKEKVDKNQKDYVLREQLKVIRDELGDGSTGDDIPEFYEKVSKNPDASKEMLTPDVIVVDPPRKGCDEKCLETIIKMKPERIVYVSCDSATLARDLRILVDGGYHLEKVRPVDQFAHTMHVETCVLLARTSKSAV